MHKFPWFGFSIAGVGFVGLGYMIMRATVPTPEQTYAAMSPDLRRKVDANRAARLAQENATKRQQAAQLDDPDSQRPVWADGSRS